MQTPFSVLQDDSKYIGSVNSLTGQLSIVALSPNGPQPHLSRELKCTARREEGENPYSCHSICFPFQEGSGIGISGRGGEDEGGIHWSACVVPPEVLGCLQKLRTLVAHTCHTPPKLNLREGRFLCAAESTSLGPYSFQKTLASEQKAAPFPPSDF